MKKNDWILIVAAGLYSFLFYEQTAGINFACFNIAIIALLTIKDQDLWREGARRIAITGCMVSAFCISWHNTSLAVVANIISLSLLSALTLEPKSSVICSLISSFYSYASAPVYMLLDRTTRRKEMAATSLSFKKTRLIVLPLLVTFLFVLLYRASSPLFNDLTKRMGLDFISRSWITFTAGGLTLCYGFLYHRKITWLSRLDQHTSFDLIPGNHKETILFGKRLHIQDEIFSGRILLVLLNLLLLIVNALDINFLFLGGALPEGITYSEFVHQGTGALIISIITAIGIILFYFRGELNFHRENKTIKLLAYCWLFQHACMLASTALRNNMYIEEYGLTYKRTGVYVYLLLTLAGLLTTFIKILQTKNNNYLFRVNGWIWYSVLILSCVLNWDLIITDYNIRHPDSLEKQYLAGLSDANLPELIILQNQPVALIKKRPLDKERIESPNDSAAQAEREYFNKALSSKLYCFLRFRAEQGWRSWYYDNTRIYNKLLALNNDKTIHSIDLSNKGFSSMEPLRALTNLDEMYLSSNGIYNAGEAGYFTSLRKLDLSANKLSGLKGIESLTQLEYLYLQGNRIYDYTPLHKLTQLRELSISNTITANQFRLLQQALPDTKITKI